MKKVEDYFPNLLLQTSNLNLFRGNFYSNALIIVS